MKRIAAALVWAAAASGQTLDLYSEFLRTDPFGEFLPSDATPRPREILSPAVARGAYASYLAVVRADRGNFFLFTGINPAGSVRAALYQVDFVKSGERWIPDSLRPAPATVFGVIPDPDFRIAGQTARVYLLDVWVPHGCPPGRIRVELQMKAGTWVIWPLEMRVLPAVVRAHGRSSKPLPTLDRPLADAAIAPLQEYLTEPARRFQTPPRSAPLTLRELVRRNAEQDFALADPALAPEIRKRFEARAAAGGEWPLAIRDLILRGVH